MNEMIRGYLENDWARALSYQHNRQYLEFEIYSIMGRGILRVVWALLIVSHVRQAQFHIFTHPLIMLRYVNWLQISVSILARPLAILCARPLPKPI